MTRLVWLVLALGACSPRRHISIEFTSAKPADVDQIAQVYLQVFDGNDCVCADLDSKPGCATTDQISAITFSPQNGERTGGGFPSGKLVVRVAAFDNAQASVDLRIACYCIPDLPDQTIVFPLGTPTMAAGGGCQ